MLKPASIYSNACRPVKKIAKTTVKNKAFLAGSLRPAIISW